MLTALEHLDKRFDELRALANLQRPARGWIRAIREALGMTTAQMAGRLGVQQPRTIELERAEADGNITVKSLERAAEALGCRLVYALVPEIPLTETVDARASALAEKHLAAVEQTMKLEAQGVTNEAQRNTAYRKMVEELLNHRARLWDEM